MLLLVLLVLLMLLKLRRCGGACFFFLKKRVEVEKGVDPAGSIINFLFPHSRLSLSLF